MPRLRRLKRDLTYEELFPDSTSPWPKPDTESSTDEVVQSGSYSPESPRGWWSNENIIASLPDAKLRENYHRYKSLADACDQELRRRACAGIKVRAESRFDITIGRHVYHAVETPRRRAKALTKTTRGLTLSPEQMIQALQMLQQIKEAKRDTHST